MPTTPKCFGGEDGGVNHEWEVQQTEKDGREEKKREKGMAREGDQ